MPYDVIVVGAGPAGIACAVEAGAAGARVLLVDKADDVGGTLHVSGGHLSAAGTRRQHERGIVDSAAEHAADVQRISGETARPDLLDLAVAGAGETVDWLDEHGFDFAPETPRIVHGHEPYAVPRTYYGPAMGRSVLQVLRPLLADAVERWHIDLWLSTAVARLVVHHGACVGVELADGSVVEAGAVVLCTGGFGAAPQLFRELEEAPLVSAAMPTSTGDGLVMARDVGAAVVGKGAYLPTFGGLAPPDGVRVRWDDRPLLVATERPPWEVYVDRSGRRFVAEDEESIDAKERALAALPDLTFWMVFDAVALAESQPMVVGWDVAELERRIGTDPGLHRADDLRTLAADAGIDADGLVATLARYNDEVATGAPDALGRTHRPAPVAVPPFYAIRNHGVTLITFSGVDVDADLRVRREDGSVVPNLYAAGEILGAAATSGNAFCGGMLLTPALTFGRWLGRRLGRA